MTLIIIDQLIIWGYFHPTYLQIFRPLNQYFALLELLLPFQHSPHSTHVPTHRPHARARTHGGLRYCPVLLQVPVPIGIMGLVPPPPSVAELLPSLLTFRSRGSTETSAGVHVYKSM